MRVVVNSELLKAALDALVPITGKSSLPALNMIKVSTLPGDRLVCEATNLSVAARRVLRARVLEPGGVCAPARTLALYVKSLEGAITLGTPRPETLEITSETARDSCRLRGFRVEEFPDIGAGLDEREPALKVDAEAFATAVKRAAKATHKDGLPALACVRVEKGGDGFTLVGTDGHRLTRVTIEAQDDDDLLERHILVDARESVALTAPPETEARVQLLNEPRQRLVMAWGEDFVELSGVAAIYPDYRAIFPRSRRAEMHVGAADFARAVRAVSLGSTILSLELRRAGSVLSAVNYGGRNDTGTAVSVALPGADTDEAITVIARASFLRDAVQGSEPLVIQTNGEREPLVVTQGNATTLIMPVSMRELGDLEEEE